MWTPQGTPVQTENMANVHQAVQDILVRGDALAGVVLMTFESRTQMGKEGQVLSERIGTQSLFSSADMTLHSYKLALSRFSTLLLSLQKGW